MKKNTKTYIVIGLFFLALACIVIGYAFGRSLGTKEPFKLLAFLNSDFGIPFLIGILGATGMFIMAFLEAKRGKEKELQQ
ncbi:MAG: hypothetical protein JW973_07180 [Bacteroidales bacterium]|nr:hypothetical protein [Bacteroidales bacterium]